MVINNSKYEIRTRISELNVVALINNNKILIGSINEIMAILTIFINNLFSDRRSYMNKFNHKSHWFILKILLCVSKLINILRNHK